MPYTAGLEDAKRMLDQLEQSRQRAGTTGDSSQYELARARLLEKIEVYERLTASRPA
jgi:hypothetical protein